MIQGSDVGPTVYVIVEGVRHPISEFNQVFKFTDDISLIVPEKIDVRLLEEFDI